MGNPIKRKKIRKLEAARAVMGEIPSVLVASELPAVEETVQEEVIATVTEEQEVVQDVKSNKKKKTLSAE